MLMALTNQPARIDVRAAPIVVADEIAALATADNAGAVVTFVGAVRGGDVRKMTLEHYPAMTAKKLHDIVAQARARWEVIDARVTHRHGELAVGDVIVFVGVVCAHRADAFAACQFIVDYLKNRAPFWKKEYRADGEQWVRATDADEAAMRRWESPENDND